MTRIGADGLDAIDEVDGVPYDTWVAIEGRARTWRHREPGRPLWGLGLADGLRDPAPSPAEWRMRVRDSLAESAIPVRSLQVVSGGGRVSIRLDVDALGVRT